MPVATLVTPPSPALKLHDSLPPPLETSPMHQFRSIRRLALGAALVGAVVGLAPAAASANKQPTCTYNDGLRQVNVADKSDVFRLQLFVQGGQIAARNDIGSNTTTVHCFSLTGSGQTATVLNTDRIVVSGTLVGTGFGGCPVGCSIPASNDGYLIDESSGAFAPGFTKEADGTSEIEILFAVPRDTAGYGPELEIIGTAAADTVRVGGPGAVNFGYDDDIDITLQSGARDVTVKGMGGNDYLTGLGSDSSIILGRSNVPLDFDGGAGNDFVYGGNAADTLSGGADGDDYFQTQDSAKDVVNGGSGQDAAITDVLDTSTSIESNVVLPIGKLRLAPRAVRARAGQTAQVNMSWTHPKAWRALRSVELQLFDAESRKVGSIAARPGHLSARGKMKVMAGSRVTHHGKTVTARLALRLPSSLAGQSLRLAVEATDREGHRQVEHDAGSIRVAG